MRCLYTFFIIFFTLTVISVVADPQNDRGRGGGPAPRSGEFSQPGRDSAPQAMPQQRQGGGPSMQHQKDSVVQPGAQPTGMKQQQPLDTQTQPKTSPWSSKEAPKTGDFKDVSRDRDLDRDSDRDWSKDRDGKDRDGWRDGRHGDRHGDRNFRAIGLRLGFTDRDFFIRPIDRVSIIYPVVQTVPDVRVFVEKVRLVDPACIFPQDGYYTLLIPVDRAFEKVVAGVTDKAKLCNILLHYIVPEPIVFDDIEGKATFRTLAGEDIVITRKGNEYWVNDVKILKPVASKDKGLVIHVLEADIQ